MHKSNRYQREKGFQKIIFVSFIGAAVVVGFKATHIIGKMTIIDDGLTYYAEESWIEAEESLQNATHYTWFQYKEAKATEVLEDLCWITNYKDYIQDLYNRVAESSLNEALDTFADAVEEYENSGFKSLTEEQRLYLLERYPVEEAISEGWTHFKTQLVHILQNPLQGDYKWAKEKIFLIPEGYFTANKEDAILELFKTCDEALYTKYRSSDGVGEFGTFIDILNEIYRTNREYNFDTQWLTMQVKTFMYETMFQKAQEDITAFANYIGVYRREVDSGYKDDAIEKLVDDFIVTQEKEIKRLLKAKQYEMLITRYKELKYFKDYTKEIEVAERMQKYDNPEMLLDKPLEEYVFMQVGKASFGASKYLVTIHKATNQLELYLLIGDYQEYEVKNYTIGLNELSIGTDELERIDVEDNLIGLKGIGSQAGNGKYVVLRLEDYGLNLIKNFEGESIELVEGIKHLRVTNPTDEEILYTYDYILGEKGYEKQEMSATEMNLDEADLMKYAGQVVKFGCYVAEATFAGNAKAYYYAGNTYYADSMAYIYKEDGTAINKGSYSIIGEVVGMEPYYNASLDLEVLRPKVRVIKMDKE